MAGFYFGTSRWDDIPAQLGMTVEGGVLRGAWNGVAMEAYFDNPYTPPFGNVDGYYEHKTELRATIDPPLFLGGGKPVVGIDPAYAAHILDPALQADLQNGLRSLGLSGSASDGRVCATWTHYEEQAARYRAAFDHLARFVSTVVARHASYPAAWEVAIRQSWPRVGASWGMAFDQWRSRLQGDVRGRRVSAAPAIHEARLVTQIGVGVALPPGVQLTLARQDGDGFWKRLFRGQDIQVGDAEFDAAFVIKGKPEEAVRALLSAPVRAVMLDMLHRGAAISLEEGAMTVWSHDVVTDPGALDALLKVAFGAADALGHR